MHEGNTKTIEFANWKPIEGNGQPNANKVANGVESKDDGMKT